MSLTQVSPDAIKDEKRIQNDIFNSIDNCQNIIFNAGAGAGKTYSLIESLKYIIKEKGERLNYHNQNIICITYTNVAANEIKERLGNSNLAKISTIHERLWELISPYQNELVKIHVEKINEELVKVVEDLEVSDKFNVYRQIKDKFLFSKIVNENKDVYYQVRNKSAADFKASIKGFLSDDYHELLKNVSNFKSLVDKIYKKDNLNICLKKIDKNEYEKVYYDSRYNNDKLHKMKISHDSLLEYSFCLIEKHDLIKQMIIDKYPFMLIDEYQDTAEKVIKIIKLLDDYSQKINHSFFVGYFGDTAQNIYDTGIGNNIYEFHAGLNPINKKYNRRSTNEVIDAINKIRNDNIEQVSIYSDADGGSVFFYCGGEDHIDKFIDKCKKEWGVSANNKLHCLVLTNELVAKYNLFENVYRKLRAAPYYRMNWQSVNSEILSHDLKKLGEVPNFLYKIVDFKMKISDPKTPITNILDEKLCADLNFLQLKELFFIISLINGGSLESVLESMFKLYYGTENKEYRRVMEDLFGEELISKESVVGYILGSLFPNLEEADLNNAKENVYDLLRIDLNEYVAWFNFVNKVEDQEVVYHTYHGTKGEQYKNVIVLMQKNFGPDAEKFSNYFKSYSMENSLTGRDLTRFVNTKNLLYVSCSRAINNLRVLYLDDINDFEESVKNIFGNVKKC